MRRRNLPFLVICVVVLLAGGRATATADPITYKTFFEDPTPDVVADYSLENHAIDLINATPAGARIGFTFRDFNRDPVVDALIAAKDRGVEVDGVIDGDEATQPPVQRLVAALGADRAVVCGSPDFAWKSCIANAVAFQPSLMHNKFLTFSKLVDGRRNVVLETSQNFFWATQYHYYNDMVEITGDRALYDTLVHYLFALKAQQRTDDFFLVGPKHGPNTIFTSPRRQPDVWTNDTIVDRMNEIQCTGGGVIRIANLTFRTQRSVILDKLVRLHDAGCDIEAVFSYIDADILARLVSEGIPVHPLWLKAEGTHRQVLMHSKFWLVDAQSTVTHRRTKIVYAGTSNWRADEQYSDDLLLRMVDDGVYDAYLADWKFIESRAVSRLNTGVAADTTLPASALTIRPKPNSAGWNNSDVVLRIVGADNHDQATKGFKRLHVEIAGTASDFVGSTANYNLQELPLTTEGDTPVTYFSEDMAGNVETPKTTTVRIDKTAPTIAGMPHERRIWAPNHTLVHVADITGADDRSGVADLTVTASSNVPWRDRFDIVIRDGSVWLRATPHRVYRIVATVTDAAGNVSTAEGRFVVGPRHRHHH